MRHERWKDDETALITRSHDLDYTVLMTLTGLDLVWASSGPHCCTEHLLLIKSSWMCWSGTPLTPYTHLVNLQTTPTAPLNWSVCPFCVVLSLHTSTRQTAFITHSGPTQGVSVSVSGCHIAWSFGTSDRSLELMEIRRPQSWSLRLGAEVCGESDPTHTQWQSPGLVWSSD